MNTTRKGPARWAWGIFLLAGFAANCLAQPLKLQNERLTLTLGNNGEIVSLVDRATQLEFAAPKAAPLFTFAFSKKAQPGGELFYLSSADAGRVGRALEEKGARRVLTLDYTGLGGWPIQARCTATTEAGDPLVRWRLTMKVPEGLVLENVIFPHVMLRAPLGDKPEGNAALLGSTKGGVVRGPVWMKPGSSVAARQPGNLAAQFGCYYAERAGFYTAAHDGKGYRKGITLERAAEGIKIFWNQSCFESNAFALDYDVVMTTFAGADKAIPTDWRDAADIYKSWALTQPWCATPFEKRTDVPAWMKNGPAMVRFTRNWLERPERIEAWITDYWRRHFPQVPLITAYWGWEKINYWITPDYFPVYPADEPFARLVERTRRLGAHAFPWPSGYHWTLTFDKQADGKFTWDDRQRFDRIGRPHAVINRDGKLYLRQASWLRGGETASLCPGDPWTIDWWNRDICVPLARLGCEMIQVDQVVGGSFPPCYSPSHGHAPGPQGLWMTEAFVRQMRTMMETCRRIQPDAVVCYEEPNELFNHLAGIQDYRDCESTLEWASVFNYLYHEYLPTFQSNPRAGDRVMAAHCLVTGQIPHLVPRLGMGEGTLLLNGGYEAAPIDPNAQLGWERVPGYQGRTWAGKTARDEAEKHGGTASLRLENTADGDTVQVAQNVTIEPQVFAVGKKYRLGAWMKTGQMSRPNSINLAFLGLGTANPRAVPGKTGFLGPNTLAFPKAEAGWVHRSTEFVVPDSAYRLRIMIHVAGRARAWVDDVTLEEIRPDGTAVEVRQPSIPSDHEFMRQWVTLFHGEGRPYLAYGRMLHPPRLKCATLAHHERRVPAVFHNAFRASDGGEAVVLANASAQKQAATLEWKGRSLELELKPEEVRLIR